MFRFSLLVTIMCLTKLVNAQPIMPADANYKVYNAMLRGKNIALVMNQASIYNDTLILDRMLHNGLKVAKIFVPEHGFRGKADAGAHVANEIDSATGIPVISLYGKNKKPSAADLKDIDVVVYDLQDVGVRFYTYISTLQYCMEACAENHKEMVVLDRPNPNGFYVDGPVLEKGSESFVGMQCIPVVYGMTAGEYGMMLQGEHWANGVDSLQMNVIPCMNYTHKSKYVLPVAPSPNLKTMAAVYAYPSLCFFEGTPISVGRGTDKPFCQYGCPAFEHQYSYSFTPRSMVGAVHPPYENKVCYGRLVAPDEPTILKELDGKMNIEWLVDAYNHYPEPEKFFTPFFDKLAGGTQLRKEIEQKTVAADIRKHWKNELNTFLKIRKKYLLYPDF